MTKPNQNQQAKRRSFLTRMQAGAASLALGGIALAQVKAPATPFKPVPHDKDNWLDELPGKHRVIFDTTGAEGLADAMLFANNYMFANRVDYGIESRDLAVILQLRHRSTVFAFNDAMWAKYGAGFALRTGYEDPKTKGPSKINIYNSGEYASVLSAGGLTLDALVKAGVQFAVCATATRNIANLIAKTSGGDADAIFKELTANLVTSNARMVPAGIITITRAQERGYAIVKA